LDGDSITNPASLIVSVAAVAALEQFVPITPMIVGSAATFVAAVWPPSALQPESSTV
jgi:hypothetical protein